MIIIKKHLRPVHYKDPFEEGEFRKRVQFMFPGKLRRVKFKYMGYSMEVVEEPVTYCKGYRNRKRDCPR